MSAVSVPEVITELAALVKAGDIPAARKLGRKLINTAETRQLWLIARIADLFENRPRTAVAILRHWWKNAPTQGDRDLIATFVATGGERHGKRDAAGREPRGSGRNNYRAPSTVQVEQGDDFRSRRRSRQEQSDAADFAAYQAERAGLAEGEQVLDRDERTHAAKVYASGFDYDRAALYGTDVAFRCLSCSINRGRYDLNRDRMTEGHGDDGLCADCRESGRPCIPELPAGHSLADAVTARCAVIRAEYGDTAARAMLRAEWRQATMPAVRPAIATYVAANLSAEQPAEVTADEPAAEVRADQERPTTRPAPRKSRRGKVDAEAPAQEPPAAEVRVEEPAEVSAVFGTCASCPDERTARDLRGVTVDDGLCAECRAVDAEQDGTVSA